MRVSSLVLVCLLAASDHGFARDATPPAPPAKPPAKPCPTEKIQFTKETGCQNDGYVEFCVPATDKKLQAAIKRIAPHVENKGLQRCDPNELLFFLPVDVESGSC